MAGSVTVLVCVFWFDVLDFSKGFKSNAAATAECPFIATPSTIFLSPHYRQWRHFYFVASVFFTCLLLLYFELRIDSPVSVKR